MAIDLGTLKPSPGSTQKRRRLGRGIGSGLGKTSGRGHKGRGSRSGGNTPPGYEGGQMPLTRRLPKRGFRPLKKWTDLKKQVEEVNLKRLAIFPEGATVDPAAMVQRGLIKEGRTVKVLGDGELKQKLTVRAHAFSKSAQEKITAAGGSAELLEAVNA